MNITIALKQETDAKAQKFLATNPIARFIVQRVDHNNSPNSNDLLSFWSTYPDNEHCGAALWRKFFCIKPE
jgi:hypothetical protein